MRFDAGPPASIEHLESFDGFPHLVTRVGVTSLQVALRRGALETNAACPSASKDTAAQGIS
jgi:hypothetical protein